MSILKIQSKLHNRPIFITLIALIVLFLSACGEDENKKPALVAKDPVVETSDEALKKAEDNIQRNNSYQDKYHNKSYLCCLQRYDPDAN